MKGISLLEVLITILIFAFISCGIYGVLNLGNITFSTDLTLLNLQHQARQGMEWMVRDIRQAIPSSVVISGGLRIDFNIPNDSDTISYYLNNGQLIREEPSGSEGRRIVANDINNLCFFCNTCGDNCANPNSLQIRVDAYKVANGKPFSFFWKERVRLRNE